MASGRRAGCATSLGTSRGPVVAPLVWAALLAGVHATGHCDEATDRPPGGASGDAQSSEEATAVQAPCPEFAGTSQPWLERARAGVEHSVCLSAWRFDSFFGNREDEEITEAASPYGRLRIGALWDERDGLDPELRMRATIPLPLMERRLRAVVGRETDEEFIEDASREFRSDPLFGEDRDAGWLVGLGYDPVRGRNSRLSLGAGLKLQSPLNPYVKANYRYFVPLTEEVLARIQQTVFWENEEGFGTSTRGGLDWLLDESRLLRWNNYLKLTEETRGTAWNTQLTLYQRLSDIRAVALRAGVRGETGREYDPIEYGLEAIYRQPFLREWLFVEVRAGGGWVRKKVEEPRDFVLEAGIVFEMVFGRHPAFERRKRELAPAE